MTYLVSTYYLYYNLIKVKLCSENEAFIYLLHRDHILVLDGITY